VIRRIARNTCPTLVQPAIVPRVLDLVRRCLHRGRAYIHRYDPRWKTCPARASPAAGAADYSEFGLASRAPYGEGDPAGIISAASTYQSVVSLAEILV
jgi:hypothetical protein